MPPVSIQCKPICVLSVTRLIWDPSLRLLRGRLKNWLYIYQKINKYVKSVCYLIGNGEKNGMFLRNLNLRKLFFRGGLWDQKMHFVITWQFQLASQAKNLLLKLTRQVKISFKGFVWGYAGFMLRIKFETSKKWCATH